MKLNVDHPAYVLVYGALVAGLFTAAIMSLQAAAGDKVKGNELAFEQKALVELFEQPLEIKRLEDLSEADVRDLYAKHIRRGLMIDAPAGKLEVVRAVTALPGGGERLLGYGFKIGGVGFWSRIDGWLAVSPDLEKLQGIVFVKHSETPGLGGRIAERGWRSGFKGLSVGPAGEERIYIGPRGPQGRRTDAITGATGTSRAVESFLNEDMRVFCKAAEAAGLKKAGRP